MPRRAQADVDLATPHQTLIVAGRLSPSEAARLLEYCQHYRLPILADLNSQLRLHPSEWVIHYADLLLNNAHFVQTLNRFERVIQFSGQLISKRLLAWLGTFNGEHLIVDGQRDYLDPNHRAQQRQQSLPDFLRELAALPLGWPPCAEVVADH